jgi:hypothetical protein
VGVADGTESQIFAIASELMGTSKKNEIDVLAEELPSVFDRKALPPTWDDDWIFAE